MENKKKITYIVIGIVAVILIAVVTFFIWRENIPRVPQVRPKSERVTKGNYVNEDSETKTGAEIDSETGFETPAA